MPAATYEIAFEGPLTEESRRAFEPLRVVERDGLTCLVGQLPDQAALHGVLARLDALELHLVEVTRLPPSTSTVGP
jgi:hypothetical protein